MTEYTTDPVGRDLTKKELETVKKMADRMKVIKALDCCDRSECDECPYYDPEVADSDYYGICHREDMMKTALKLLRAQETAERRIEEKLEQIVPPIEGDPGADFDLGCRQGLKFALKTLREVTRDGTTTDVG